MRIKYRKIESKAC